MAQRHTGPGQQLKGTAQFLNFKKGGGKKITRTIDLTATARPSVL